MALGIGALSVFASVGARGGEVPEWSEDPVDLFQYPIQNEDWFSVLRNDRDVFAFAPNSMGQVAWQEQSWTLEVELTSGGLFYSNLAGDYDLVLDLGHAQLHAEESQGYVEWNEEASQFMVYAIEHPSEIHFVQNGETLNVLPLSSMHRVKVPASKVSSTLAKLRLTKLVKEFPAFDFELEDLDAEVQGLLVEANARYVDRQVDFEQEASADSDLGPSSDGAFRLLSRLKAWLSFTPYADDKLAVKEGDAALRFAMSNALFGDSSLEQDWISAWISYEHEEADLRALRSDLFFVLPGDELYAVKTAASELLFAGEAKVSELRRQYHEVEGLLNRGDLVNAQSAFDVYQSNFKSALNSGVFEQEDGLAALSREYVLVEQLLREHSIFYSVDDVSLLIDIEESILELAGSQEDLDEERQAFVQSRVRFLTSLFDFVFERKLSVEVASDLAEELLFTGEDYLNTVKTETAVRDYFESKLSDYDLGIDFINSPEFRSYGSFAEGLEAYKLEAADLEALDEYLQNLRAGSIQEASLSADEALAQAKEALRGGGVQFSDLIAKGDAENRLFEIQGARAAGFGFEANYDRETQILYDIELEEDLRFSAGVSLENIRNVIRLAMEEQEEEEEKTAVGNSEEISVTETVALSFAKEQFGDAGLNLRDFTLSVRDLDDNSFDFEGVLGSQELEVSGVFEGQSGKVSSVTWRYEDKEYSIPNVALEAMEGAIEATFQALYGDVE